MNYKILFHIQQLNYKITLAFFTSQNCLSSTKTTLSLLPTQGTINMPIRHWKDKQRESLRPLIDKDQIRQIEFVHAREKTPCMNSSKRQRVKGSWNLLALCKNQSDRCGDYFVVIS